MKLSYLSRRKMSFTLTNQTALFVSLEESSASVVCLRAEVQPFVSKASILDFNKTQ